MTTAAIATHLRSLLQEREISHTALAEDLGLSKAALSRRMTGEMEFRVGELREIARRLDLPLDQLLDPAPEAVS